MPKCDLCRSNVKTLYGKEKLCKRCELGRQGYERIKKSGTKAEKQAHGIFDW